MIDPDKWRRIISERKVTETLRKLKDIRDAGIMSGINITAGPERKITLVRMG